MATVIFTLDNRTVNLGLQQGGEVLASTSIEVTPHVVTDILHGIHELFEAHALTVGDISDTSIQGNVRGSSAMRAISVVSQMLDLAARKAKMTK